MLILEKGIIADIAPTVIFTDSEKRMIADITPVAIYADFGKNDACKYCSYSHLF